MLSTIIPLWAIFAFAAAISLSAVPLIQEKFKADGFGLALWNKLFLALTILPFALSAGFPEDWKFYFYMLVTALLYAFSDVIYFRNVPIIGSGLMTRLIPSSVVITFFLWFIFDPSSIKTYIDPWPKAVGVLAIFALFLYSTIHIKKCTVSWDGLRKIWPVIVVAITGAIFSKIALNHTNASTNQGPLAYIFIQSTMMVILLSGYYFAKKPVPKKIMLSRNTIVTAIIMGVVTAFEIFLKMKAVQLADNPGLVSMIMITDSLWVMLVYRLIGKKEPSNIWAGFGIVLSAFLIVVLKSIK